MDSHPDAFGGFTDTLPEYMLEVEFPDNLLNLIPDHLHRGLLEVLAQDPRPSYQNDPERIYGFEFAGFDIRFTVADNALKVCGVKKL